MKELIIAFGLFLFIEGVLYAIFPSKMKNMIKKIDLLKESQLRTGGLIFAIFWDPILSKVGILSFIDTFSSFFGPIAGIMIVDYYIIKKKKIINKDIFSSNKTGAYYYSGGWQIKSVYSLFIGFIFASATIWNIEFL